MQQQELHDVAQYLYKLLDDIDTVTDVAKSNDAHYRRLVEGIQKKKAAVVESCDGYTVVFKPLPKS